VVFATHSAGSEQAPALRHQAGRWSYFDDHLGNVVLVGKMMLGNVSRRSLHSPIVGPVQSRSNSLDRIHVHDDPQGFLGRIAVIVVNSLRQSLAHLVYGGVAGHFEHRDLPIFVA
jgi:hypothetical protein